ncbi:hypothetical protein H8K38_11480 [Undibacterium sp. FT79W]|uniref:hypothetical protein n=1 Tax=Undibacterium sp. FT79W TaxID=2762296 RepID=UPI00164A2467|nr:hypothetical protein [Undibacterium sp. FT79W]MBC3878434.1 hypothetical protein [Undibacterium sp. FT79W]
MSKEEEFFVIAYKLYSKENPNHGTIRPLFKLDANGYSKVTPENFCPSLKVFITAYYDEIDSKFKDFELFKIPVSVSVFQSEKVDPSSASKYVASGRNAERLMPKALMEVIFAELPDCNNRMIDSINVRPTCKYVFVKSDKGCFGPFEWNIDTENDALELILSTSPIPGQPLEPGQIYKIQETQYSKQFIAADDRRSYLIDLATVIQGGEFYDYASDMEIIHYCGKQATTFKSVPLDKRTLKALETQAKANAKPLIKTRWDRFAKLASTLINNQEEVSKQLGDYLNSENGAEIVELHVERQTDKYLSVLIEKNKDKIQDEISKLDSELRQAKDRLAEINEQKKHATFELESAREEKKNLPKINSVDKKLLHAELDQLLLKKKDEIDQLENRIKKSLVHDQALSNLETIKVKTSDAEIYYDRMVARKLEIQNTIQELEREYSDREENISKKLSLMTPMVKAINGFSSITRKSLPIVRTEIASSIDPNNLLTEQERVCAAVEKSLAKLGRNIPSIQVANLLICTQQSFITFLSGLPGAGKTSLSRLLATSQSLKTRFNEVSVGRGWTSQKDLIGFYNPLINKFQASSTGIYEFLLALKAESETNQVTPMAYILLDEANLSPIEHYWSAFFGMTDKDGSKFLTLGNDVVAIPNCLRFLATINHDGTTEPLSPRTIDRAPFIVMESNSFTNEDVANLQELVSIFPLSHDDMELLFGNSSFVPVFNDMEASIFNEIRSVLSNPSSEKGRPIIISVRKEHSIRQYCNKARALMNFDSDFVALDYAVLQHILPLVRGSGTKFAKRLDELLIILRNNNLTHSEQYLNQMINYGAAELHSYDFFCW